MEKITVSLKEFMNIFFETQNINNKVKLTPREISGLVELILFNYKNLNPSSPYKGEGRKKIYKMLGLSPANYGLLLKSLCDKGYLIKGQGLSNYNLHPRIIDLFYNNILPNKNITLSNEYIIE